MQDRRARLRPKEGARSFYYGSKVNPATSLPWENTLRSNTIGQLDNLPWLSNVPFAPNAPNAPIHNRVTFEEGTTTEDAMGIMEALNSQGQTSDLINRAMSQNIKNGATSMFDAGNLLAPLAATNGLVFPYTPNINISQNADYNTYETVHSNNEFHAYARTRLPMLTVSGEFTVQNMDEAHYALAAIHFARTVIKMDFGSSPNAGTPPPVLLFDAYGEYMFNEFPVVVTNYTVDFNSSVDYVQVPHTNTWLPCMFTLVLQLVPYYTPAKSRSFNLESFRNGSLLKNRKGWM